MGMVKTESIEGPEAFARFKAGVKAVLSVSHDELMKRERAYQRKAAKNPNRRGPKRKAKT